MRIVDVNPAARLSFNTRYLTIRVNPTQKCVAYTYNGLSRCPRCLCLQSNPQSHMRACRGRLRVKMHGHRCENGCGMLFPNPAQARRHASSCEGLIIGRDRYNTLVCPKCQVAGFSPNVVTRHVRQCGGDRAQTLASYSNRQVIHECGGCGDHFFGHAMATHTCHVFGDPLWLAESEPPDLTVSYVRWCRDRGLTLGGCPGTMPDAVRDTTISIPSGSPDGPRGLDDTDSCSDEDSSDEEDGWEVGGADPDRGDGQRRMLADAGITFAAFEPAACQGVVWRHGFFPCPFGTTITAGNVRLRRLTLDGESMFQIDSSCMRCASLKRSIKKWLREGKYTREGLQLCRRTSCREPAVTLWHCRRHADMVTATNHSREYRRGRARAVTPAAMAEFVASIRPRVLVSPPWRSVRDAMRGGQDQGTGVFFVDTESVYDRLERRFLVCQLGVRGAPSADLLLFTVVDHGLSFRELRERVGEGMWPKLAGLYDFAGLESRTHGMTPEQVAGRLVDLGMSESSHLVEWSLGGFDLRALQATFGASIFPRTALLGHQLWRNLGLSGSVALQPLFYAHQPLSLLNRRHHEADVDSAKLYIMVQGALGCFS